MEAQRTLVLLIEENPADASRFREALSDIRGARFDVFVVDRLSAALEVLTVSNFDVVLLDLSSRDGQGLDTLRKLRAIASSVPIVVLTALDDDATAIAAMKEGAQDYLLKQHAN